MSGATIKNAVLATVAGMGGVLAQAFGGMDSFLQALITFMIADYVTGILVAFIFCKSNKTENGGASSAVGFRGIVKKLCILLLIALAVRIDKMSNTGYIRSAVIFFFMGNEGLSIIENLGLMGVPYPEFMRRALEAMKEKGNSGNSK